MALNNEIKDKGGGGGNVNMASWYFVTAKYRCLRPQ